MDTREFSRFSRLTKYRGLRHTVGVLVVIVTVVAALLTRVELTTAVGVAELFVVTSFILPTLLAVTESVASSPFSRAGFSTFSSISLETSSWDFCTGSSSSILKSTDLQEPLILSTTSSDLTGLSPLPSLVLKFVVALLSAAATSSTAKSFDAFSEKSPAASRRQATVDGDVDGNNDDVNVVVVVVVVLLIDVVFVTAVVVVVAVVVAI
uniref:Uncharacterized protein n=1 Tax=Glossina austeni TaxID=7395 RepID=A0A1A9UT09_GLOAU